MPGSGLSRNEQSAVEEFKRGLLARLAGEVLKIKLFGSKARGTSHEESDVDLLIIVRERTTDLNDAIIDLVCHILNTYGVFLETVTLSASEYAEAQQKQYPFALNVERDAVLL